jgi:NAD(P)-dependent dehydrogenase (short-subunit alcohol dehydrogenase family)
MIEKLSCPWATDRFGRGRLGTGWNGFVSRLVARPASGPPVAFWPLDKDSGFGRPQRAARSERDRPSRVPFGKAETPQDIANGALFLASDASNYATGAELAIDGGITGGARSRWS